MSTSINVHLLMRDHHFKCSLPDSKRVLPADDDSTADRVAYIDAEGADSTDDLKVD